MCSGGLEPHFRVLFSAIFQGVSLGNFHQPGKKWNVVEAKSLQTAANLRTLFWCVLIMFVAFPRPRKPGGLKFEHFHELSGVARRQTKRPLCE
jgi:hypothetical protein